MCTMVRSICWSQAALICTEVVGNAITPDVSLVYTRVSVCIDIERYWLHQPPVSCLVTLASLCVRSKRKSLFNHSNVAWNWKWAPCVYIKVCLRTTSLNIFENLLYLACLTPSVCACGGVCVCVCVGIDHLFDLKASSEKISQVINPFGGLY